MDSVVEICFGIVIWGSVIGMLVGYTIMAVGIGEAWGPPMGIIAFVTILGVFLMAFFGIWYNHKIQLGAQIFFWSLAPLTILVMLLSFL